MKNLLTVAVVTGLLGATTMAYAVDTTTSCSSTGAAQVLTQAVSGTPGNVVNTFICLGDLDGTGKHEVIVGYTKMAPNGTVTGKATIINNNGSVRGSVAF